MQPVPRRGLMTTRRADLQHGTNAAYVQGCVCKECRDYQRERMRRSRQEHVQLRSASGRSLMSSQIPEAQLFSVTK